MFLNAQSANVEEVHYQETDESDMKESTVIHMKGTKERGDKAQAGKRCASEAAHS